jgi:N-acetyl-anhydromuramyl-L-alanine amidase AmpD
MSQLFRTKPLPIIDVPADDQHHGGVRWSPKLIFLHASGGTSSLKWLTVDSPPTNPVSSHRLITKPGTIFKLVPDDENAWTQGYGVLGGRGPTTLQGGQPTSLFNP